MWSGAAYAQTVTEWSSESRTSLSFKVDADAVQRLLPAGWVSAPSTSAGTPDANLTVTFMERVIVLDPKGAPVRTGTSRYVVVGVPARNLQTGEVNTMIVGGLSPEGAGAYAVYRKATVAKLDRTTSGESDSHAHVRESWEFASVSGDRVELRLAFQRGAVTKTHAETVVRSAAKPEFQRTYRIDQATDVLRSVSTTDHVEQLTFLATGPSFSKLFDGSETLLGVSAIPFYVREISVP
jgi:hypothetical protein